MSEVDSRRGWSKEKWDAWYAEQRRKAVIAKSSGTGEGWAPTTLSDAGDVTTGSRVVANQIAAQMHRDHPNLSFQECVARVFAQHPALYESELAASQHITEAQYDGRPLI
jgi:hypothetical protein